MISNLDVRDALANRLYDSSTLVAKHNREGAFRIVSRELQERVNLRADPPSVIA